GARPAQGVEDPRQGPPRARRAARPSWLRRRDVPARVWQTLAGLIVLLLLAVLGLDQWQARHGESSLFGLPWPAVADVPPTIGYEPRRLRAQPVSLSDAPPNGTRVAVIVNRLEVQREVLEALRDLGRPVTVALLPGSTSTAVARIAARSGMEVLL